MSIIQFLLGLLCASGIYLFMRQVAMWASRYMIRHLRAPVGLKLLQREPDGVKVTLSGPDNRPVTAWHRGSGPAIVIVPDAGLGASAYTAIWSFLHGYGFRVILMESPAFSQNLNTEEYVRDIEAVMKQLRIQHPILLGHGLGAYSVFLHQAKAINGLATKASSILSVSGFAGHHTYQAPSFFRQLFHHERSHFARCLAAFGDGVSRHALLALQDHQIGELWAYLTAPCPVLESVLGLSQLDIPVTLLASPGDEIVPFFHTQRLASLIPHSYRKWVVDGAGHMLIWERPMVVVDEIRAMAQRQEQAKQA